MHDEGLVPGVQFVLPAFCFFCVYLEERPPAGQFARGDGREQLAAGLAETER